MARELVGKRELTCISFRISQLWDVTDDQDAVNLIANELDPQAAAAKLLQHALSNFSTDNTSVMVVRFDCDAASINANPSD
jgi:serine/threonine protein phosphatase PrpC